MTLYSTEVLRVDASGNLAIACLTIDDGDSTLASQDPFATYAVDGVTLALAPVIDFGSITGTALDGSALSGGVTHFNSGGFDYYMLDSNIAPQEFAAVTSASNAGIVGGFPYLPHSVTLDDAKLFIGQALYVIVDGANQPSTQGIVDVVVNDDDNRIQINGLSAEVGVTPMAFLGGQNITEFDGFDSGSGATGMVLAEVTGQTASGPATFEALRFSIPLFGGGALVYYIPRVGSVDLSTVQTYLSETLLPGSANGLTYGEFGLGAGRHLTNGTATADYLHGSMLHDELLGRNGADSLLGGVGADLLDGGNGADLLKGGTHRDTLFGGDGNDNLSGGIDADRLAGGAGSDRLFGGFGVDVASGGIGNDRIYGGEGNDTLTGNLGADTVNGGAGNDMLDGSAGRDQLRGNAGADRFVFAADGVTDRLLDFQNGQDLIDLAEAFATLIITTISPGTVHIDHSGEVLILTNTAGTLTAADLTAADFV